MLLELIIILTLIGVLGSLFIIAYGIICVSDDSENSISVAARGATTLALGVILVVLQVIFGIIIHREVKQLTNPTPVEESHAP